MSFRNGHRCFASGVNLDSKLVVAIKVDSLLTWRVIYNHLLRLRSLLKRYNNYYSPCHSLFYYAIGT